MAGSITTCPWSKKAGASPLHSEQHEAQLLNEQNNCPNSQLGTDFPSLSDASKKKKNKKKSQTISLAEFNAYCANKSVPSHEPMVLPTGPRQRTVEELERISLGDGFRSYGSKCEASSSRWGSSKELGRSRADETDNWASAKKFTAPGNGIGRKERGWCPRGISNGAGADSDNWGSNNSFTPLEGGRSESERRGSFFNGAGADSDNWAKSKKDGEVRTGGEWPRLVLQPRTLAVSNDEKKPKGLNPFGEIGRRLRRNSRR